MAAVTVKRMDAIQATVIYVTTDQRIFGQGTSSDPHPRRPFTHAVRCCDLFTSFINVCIQITPDDFVWRDLDTDY